MIDLNQFEILCSVHDGAVAYATVKENPYFAENAFNELLSMGLLVNEEMVQITQKGIEALEPYRVKRAIFLAAGFGSRLVPVTLSTPKPLIQVNGNRLIDRLIDAVVDAGIEEIVIVRGYLKDSFEALRVKYPQVRFIDNDGYNKANNISSAYLVRDILDNALVLESDLLLYNSKIIRKYEYRSMYMGIPMAESDDWILETEGDLIVDIGITGTNTNQMVGISYWDQDDAKTLSEDLKHTFESESGKQLYWDEVALRYNREKYKIYLRKVTLQDVVEIDTFAELCEIDERYKGA
ncbi:NTP transferase domain-containing protein [Erysipelothrix sp. HDW6B]|uniref:sugar phosphate nucleotidyltransferase n=1 Tax=Erysipelothrix sp. HDW6B TaxID=2714929 RepID=UPI00140BA5D6|nr:sugar phosphate nucleotidyltransferase [Erysipelothrix sp. HDW6B]QIK85743.1 NTP transferase domain-containing protein [Erysipelothrix sp. HDW6B]